MPVRDIPDPVGARGPAPATAVQTPDGPGVIRRAAGAPAPLRANGRAAHQRLSTPPALALGLALFALYLLTSSFTFRVGGDESILFGTVDWSA